jgi:two-component system, LytTR family, sensor kinase
MATVNVDSLARPDRAAAALSDRAGPRNLQTMEHPLPRWSFRTLLLGWSVPAALTVPFAIVSLRTAPPGLAPWRILVVVVVAWQIWTLLTLPVLALADRLPLQRPWRARAVLAHAATSLAMCAAHALVTATVFRAFVDATTSTLPSLWGYMILRFAPSGVILYTAIVALRSMQLERARAEAAAARLAEARLQSLRAQLRPHFLFNALNATVALVRDGENARAADALVGIAELLRATLRGDARHEVTLEEELAFVEQYLAIERLRMGERLKVEVDVPAALLDARVPSLCLQPFVENAVRHGLRHVAGEAVVGVSARATDGRLQLQVTDNGVGIPSEGELAASPGIGIGNARARLALLHGTAASVRFGAGAGGRGTTAELIVPLARGAR